MVKYTEDHGRIWIQSLMLIWIANIARHEPSGWWNYAKLAVSRVPYTLKWKICWTQKDHMPKCYHIIIVRILKDQSFDSKSSTISQVTTIFRGRSQFLWNVQRHMAWNLQRHMAGWCDLDGLEMGTWRINALRIKVVSIGSQSCLFMRWSRPHRLAKSFADTNQFLCDIPPTKNPWEFKL